MPMDQHNRFLLTSSDIAADRKHRLIEEFPECFSESELDIDKFKVALGEPPREQRERYELSWAGKSDAIRCVMTPSVGALIPAREDSRNFDTTANLFIEGDNLEVLKLLQRSYYGRIKMIYIDPPYNTGNEFIYPDNFREGLDEYLRYSGQRSEDGAILTTSVETSGRFHSRWLSMMYPRLFLARNLLSEDGFILVSISDHEVGNLRILLNEVFGEENFVAQLVWKSRQFPDSRSVTRVSTDHEYILVYSRATAATFRGVERDEAKFRNPDNDPRGPWMSRSILGLATAEQRPNLHYDIVDPVTDTSYSPPPNTGWRYNKERMSDLIGSGCILFPADPSGRPREKKFRADLKNEHVSFPTIIDDVFTAQGTAEIRELFGFQAFDFPKPAELLRRLIEQVTDREDIILDFFAGSASTAHAVWLQNRKDEGQRRFICVQLPEAVDESTELANRGYSTIADIGRERLRRVAKGLSKSDDEGLGFGANEDYDEGFRAFKLSASNFKIWDGEDISTDADALAGQLKFFADHVLPDRGEQDILYELMLKAGLQLTAKIEEKDVAGQTAYSLADGLLLICLADSITQECLRAMADLMPQRIVCLDPAFKGNDQLKTNTVLEMRSCGIEFRTV